jgi:hypothetical protein
MLARTVDAAAAAIAATGESSVYETVAWRTVDRAARTAG